MNCSPTNSPVTAIPATKARGHATAWITILVMLWGTGIALGMVQLIDYAAAPGAAGNAVSHWPADSLLKLSTDRPTLLMFVHPHCPCTRASVGELAQLQANSPGAFSIHILVYAPAEWSSQRIESDVWKAAAAIPEVNVQQDPNGVEAQRFEALTSGQVLVYDPQGQLQFRGGITGARGHSGFNLGRSAVKALVDGSTRQTPSADSCPVYGCPLFSPSNP